MSVGVKESEIIKRVKRGDENAFEEIFYRYYPRLFAFAYEFMGSKDLAKDMVQEVFIKFWQKRENFTPYSLSGLLFTMVRNQCLNYLRHLKVLENKKINIQQSVKLEELYRIDFVRDQPYTFIEKELNKEVSNAVRKLPPKSRKVFIMSRIEGMKNRDIADKLGFSTKNVEKHLSKALKYFRQHFHNHRLYLNPIIISGIFITTSLMC